MMTNNRTANNVVEEMEILKGYTPEVIKLNPIEAYVFGLDKAIAVMEKYEFNKREADALIVALTAFYTDRGFDVLPTGAQTLIEKIKVLSRSSL